MNPGDLAPAATAVLLQWWLWSALSTLAVLLVVRLLNMRRVEIEDLLMKTLVVAQIGLLLAAAASLHPVLRSHADSERGGSGGIDSTPRIPPGLVAPRPEASLLSSEPTPSRTRRARVSTLEAATTLTRPTHASVARHGIELELDAPRWIPSLIVLLASLGWFWGLLRLIRDVLVSRRLGAAGVAATQAALVATGRRAHERLGLVRRVPLRVVDALPSAMLVGWLRPVVLIPSSWLRPGAFDSERLEMLLVHELAHARRRDLAWRLALRVLGLVSWPLSFHRPLERHLQRVSEVICDRIASKEASTAELYAESLVLALRLSRESLTAALVSRAVCRPTFLKRRLDMILTPRKRPGRNARWAAAGILAATCLALPWLRVSVAAPGDDLLALKDSRGATRQIPKAELPEDIQKARRELASRLLEQARAEYRSKRFDLCREYLFQANRLGGLGDEVFVLDAEVGVLSLMGSVQQNEVYRAGKSGSAPVMLRWIEGRFGPLPRESVRFWTDVDEGLLVQPVEKLEEIRKVFLRRPEKKRQLLIEFRVVQMDPEAVTRCLAEVGVEAPKAAGPLTAKLDAAQSRRFEGFVNSEDGVVVINGPMLTTNSDQLATIEISTEEAFIEKYTLLTRGEVTVADPVIAYLRAGSRISVFPLVDPETETIHLFTAADIAQLKGFEVLKISLPNAFEVPLQVPEIEKNRLTRELVMKSGDAFLIGEAPGAKPEGLAKYSRTWLWVRVETIHKSER